MEPTVLSPPVSVVLVAGTWCWDGSDVDEWHRPTSPFVTFLRGHGVEPVFGREVDGPHPFTWSTRLGGIGIGTSDLVEWHAAGINLFNYIVPPMCPEHRIPPRETNLIAHSHGLQVALFACAEGLEVNTLISVGSPVREDMAPYAKLARPRIRRWLHLHSDESDRMQWLGEMFDGHVGIVRDHPLADVNQMIPGVGHSDILRDPARFHLWVDERWLAWFRADAEADQVAPTS